MRIIEVLLVSAVKQVGIVVQPEPWQIDGSRKPPSKTKQPT
jgi:hypothetical protein